MCVQTESDEHDERHKITYKVNVKMRLEAMLLQVTQISRYMRCESCDVVFIASSRDVKNIELFRQRRVMLCHDSQSLLRNPDGTRAVPSCERGAHHILSVSPINPKKS